MRIELRSGLRSPIPSALCVGLIDGKPLSYVDRTPYIGTEPTTHAAIAEPLADAVDEAAQRVFGGEWNGDLSRVTGINRRTVTHDRIMRYGLPPWVLALVGRASAHPHPRALGFHLLGLAALRDTADWADIRDRDSMRRIAIESIDEAIDITHYAFRSRMPPLRPPPPEA
jgi:hypothetical protein